MIQILKFLSASSLSITVAGNVGIAPFLTLFLLGTIGRFNPDALPLNRFLESLLSSLPSLATFGILAIGECVAHCMSKVDQSMDSVVTFVVPIVSLIGSFSTIGLYDEDLWGEGDEEDQQSYDSGDGDRRSRILIVRTFLFGALVVFQVVVVVVGVGVSLSMHLLKMLVRLDDDRQPRVVTLGEVSFCTTTLVLSILHHHLAVVTASLILCASGYSFKCRYWDSRPNRKGGRDVVDDTIPAATDGEIGCDYVHVASPDGRNSDKFSQNTQYTETDSSYHVTS